VQFTPQPPQFGSRQGSTQRAGLPHMIQSVGQATQPPFRHVCVLTAHTFPHSPQLLGSDVRSRSQPSANASLQLPKPAMHRSAHEPPVHTAPVVCAGRGVGAAQGTLHPPQLVMLVAVLISQPSLGFPLQSANPARHVNLHCPATHAGFAFGGAGQTVSHPGVPAVPLAPPLPLTPPVLLTAPAPPVPPLPVARASPVDVPPVALAASAAWDLLVGLNSAPLHELATAPATNAIAAKRPVRRDFSDNELPPTTRIAGVPPTPRTNASDDSQGSLLT